MLGVIITLLAVAFFLALAWAILMHRTYNSMMRHVRIVRQDNEEMSTELFRLLFENIQLRKHLYRTARANNAFAEPTDEEREAV